MRNGLNQFFRISGATLGVIVLAGVLFVWPLDYSLSPSDFTGELLVTISGVRSFTRVQVCRTRYLAATKKADEAASVCLEQFRIIRLQDETPTLVSSLVNTACRRQMLDQLSGILQTAALTPDTHQAIAQALAAIDTADHFARALKSERAFGIESYSYLPGTLNADCLNYLQFMSQQIEIAEALPFEITYIKPVATSGMAALVVPAIQGGRESLNRTRTTIRCLRILNAILAHGMKTRKVKVAKLGLPTEAIVDPYSGRSLIVSSTKDGWLIYGVGSDAKDDGGNARDDVGTFLDVAVE